MGTSRKYSNGVQRIFSRTVMRKVIEIIYSGENYCIFPGNPYTIANEFEKTFKEIAYTSEREIDWHVEQIAERVGSFIIRGVKIHIDPWLYEKYNNI